MSRSMDLIVYVLRASDRGWGGCSDGRRMADWDHDGYDDDLESDGILRQDDGHGAEDDVSEMVEIEGGDRMMGF